MGQFDYIYIAELHKYMAKYQGMIVSYCKISDIIMGFGNVIVYTEPEFRNRGLATNLLSLLISKCIEENIIPMYIVDSTNNYSILLAKKLGFKIKAEEIIISDKN